ncbi:hypothetical protein SAMN05421538_103167 [Paracoccus isoporae]|uniref:Flagellar FliJ protein n=1 Tax=Paracoccus isoporae TaxID=591205 RepID=A0A1G6Z7Y9_9RHOB|nr:hypothetical protein [Paracoccus isoporae]SDD97995.1 hypothetical protein SAMN05421538_103167 [Paracoccus isoporae]
MARPARDKLDRLAQLAQLRADAELKRFAAFRLHVEALQQRRDQAQDRLRCGVTPQAFSLAEARLANFAAQQAARELLRLDAEVQRIRPGFDAARGAARREFGRVQVLKALAARADAGARRAVRRAE